MSSQVLTDQSVARSRIHRAAPGARDDDPLAQRAAPGRSRPHAQRLRGAAAALACAGPAPAARRSRGGGPAHALRHHAAARRSRARGPRRARGLRERPARRLRGDHRCRPGQAQDGLEDARRADRGVLRLRASIRSNSTPPGGHAGARSAARSSTRRPVARLSRGQVATARRSCSSSGTSGRPKRSASFGSATLSPAASIVSWSRVTGGSGRRSSTNA